MKKLEGKTAVISGGNSGIGLATAQEFIDQGAKVIITGRNASSLAEAAASLGTAASYIVSDVSKTTDLDQLKDEVAAIAGTIDILFINAGVAFFAPFEQVNEEFFDQQFNINVKGAFFTVQKLLPILNDNGSIILNASAVTKKGMAGGSVYTATKAALNSLASTLSAELVGRGIRVNTVHPGPIATPIYDKMGMPAEQQNQFATDIASQIPMARFGDPSEIAKAVLFLASSDSSYIIGTELLIDGGFTQF